MILAVSMCSLAMLHLVLSDTATDDFFSSNFLSDDSRIFPDFNVASSSLFDSSTQPLDFSNSEAPSLEDNFFTDPSPNTPLEDESFAFPADPIFESSCRTDDSSSALRFFKRDGSGSLCAPRIDDSLPLKLKLPDLNDIEAQVDNWPEFSESTVPTEEIPFITGISRDDEQCRKPRRRLCCIGPSGGLIDGYNLHYLMNGCRGKIKVSKKIHYFKCVWAWYCRLWTLAMHRNVRCLLSNLSGEFNVGRFLTSWFKINSPWGYTCR